LTVISFAGDPAYPGSPSSMAMSVPVYQQGKLIEVDLVLHETPRLAFSTAPGPDEMDLQGVAVHELGHFFGLDHTPVPRATMNARWPPTGDLSWRTLEPDDQEGITALYPAQCSPEDAGPATDASGDGGPPAAAPRGEDAERWGCSVTPSASVRRTSGPGLGLLLTALLLVGCAVRRRLEVRCMLLACAALLLGCAEEEHAMVDAVLADAHREEPGVTDARCGLEATLRIVDAGDAAGSGDVFVTADPCEPTPVEVAPGVFTRYGCDFLNHAFKLRNFGVPAQSSLRICGADGYCLRWLRYTCDHFVLIFDGEVEIIVDMDTGLISTHAKTHQQPDPHPDALALPLSTEPDSNPAP